MKERAKCIKESHVRLLEGERHFFCNNQQILILGTTIMNEYNLLINALVLCTYRLKWDLLGKHAQKVRLGCTKITAIATCEEEQTGREDTRNWDNVAFNLLMTCIM
jgi:hypothetical protein